MRIVRIEVQASELCRSKDGVPGHRSLTLEAEIESEDVAIQAIWELQRKCDAALRSWIELHSEATPEEDASSEPDTRSIDLFFHSSYPLWAVSPTRTSGYVVKTVKQLKGTVADVPWTLVEATDFKDALSTISADGAIAAFEVDGTLYQYYITLPF